MYRDRLQDELVTWAQDISERGQAGGLTTTVGDHTCHGVEAAANLAAADPETACEAFEALVQELAERDCCASGQLASKDTAPSEASQILLLIMTFRSLMGLWAAHEQAESSSA